MRLCSRQAAFTCFASCSFCKSASFPCNFSIARCLFRNWLRSSVECATSPVGIWMIRIPVSTLFTFWPPFPPQWNFSMRYSFSEAISPCSRMMPTSTYPFFLLWTEQTFTYPQYCTLKTAQII